jgi:peroxiredoxin
VVGIALLAVLPVTVACGSGREAASEGESSTSPSLVGKSAPGFTLPSASGEEISLSDYRGKKPVLLYFSMGPGWTGCVSQVVDLQTDQAFKDLDVELLSIATDSVNAWQTEARKNDIELPLLSDEGAKVSDEYGVMQWDMMGEPGHTFVLVGRDGEVMWVRDYGASEHGGLMYVDPEDLVPQIEDKLG